MVPVPTQIKNNLLLKIVFHSKKRVPVIWMGINTLLSRRTENWTELICNPIQIKSASHKCPKRETVEFVYTSQGQESSSVDNITKVFIATKKKSKLSTCTFFRSSWFKGKTVLLFCVKLLLLVSFFTLNGTGSHHSSIYRISAALAEKFFIPMAKNIITQILCIKTCAKKLKRIRLTQGFSGFACFVWGLRLFSVGFCFGFFLRKKTGHREGYSVISAMLIHA